MNISILSEKIPWFGKYSGYECLPQYFRGEVDFVLTLNKDNIIARGLGKVARKIKGWENVRSDQAFTELKYLYKSIKFDLSHILYIENHLHIVNTKKKNFLGTIHLPFKRWHSDQLKRLNELDQLFILYHSEIDFFSEFVELEKINFIRHGIDVSFFQPSTKIEVDHHKILIVGHYLRDFDLLRSVYNIIQKEISNLYQFHFIIPSHHRCGLLNTFLCEKNVFFHENLTDEELLNEYQTSNLILMPMLDSGANTAIIQAISTGVPIVTNDVGGIRSYGGGSVFPIAKSDAVELASLFHQYVQSKELRNMVSSNQRRFAEKELDWNKIALNHIKVYQKVLDAL